jgi:aconitate hydratase
MSRAAQLRAAATTTTSLVISGKPYRAVDLLGAAGRRIETLPWTQRILLENVLRHGDEEREDAAQALLAAHVSTATAEIPFYPARVLMHDTTFGPAFVDIAAMRSAVAERGGDPAAVNPLVRVDVSVDHSIAVDHFGSADALRRNRESEYRRNGDRYRFMKWVATSMRGVRIHPPGTGIMHTINLERLAEVVVEGEGDLLYPDTLIGTDSHTPMVNGIGVLGWGVGGLEAESVMLGMPVMLKVPTVVGVRLSGALPSGMFVTDLALQVTERLRSVDVTGCFVEFFGPGVSTLSAGERAVVANMAPEYGASTAFFPVDERTLDYLQATGRSAHHLTIVREYLQQQRLWFDPELTPQYAHVIDIDLGAARLSVAGPRRPQDRLDAGQTKASLQQVIGDRPLKPGTSSTPPDGAVAIAAITSCTNTSDVRLLVAAGMVARKARAAGIRPAWWVKTSCAPGSPTAPKYLERAGLLEDLEAIGFHIVGFGCTTCIGNSGPLIPELVDAVRADGIKPVAVLSGNRNFPGRVHPEIDAAFLASPPLVVAFALAGDVARNILEDPIGRRADGSDVFLRDVWPSDTEIDDALQLTTIGSPVTDDLSEANADWDALEAPTGVLYPWRDDSTYIRRPLFVDASAGSLLGTYTATPLVVLGDDITTDHISPAGPISWASDAGRFLVQRGENALDLNVFAARRGNWEVMVRGLFTNRSVANLLDPALPPGATIHAPSGATMPLWEAAAKYRAEGTPLVILAGRRYGTGSSRDWAAKGTSLLGVRAVLATSFERIHRSNLIGMGILPLILPDELHPDTLALTACDRIFINADPSRLEPRALVAVEIRKKEGTLRFNASAAVETKLEASVLRAGGMIPHMMSQLLTGTAAQ